MTLEEAQKLSPGAFLRVKYIEDIAVAMVVEVDLADDFRPLQVIFPWQTWASDWICASDVIDVFASQPRFGFTDNNSNIHYDEPKSGQVVDKMFVVSSGEKK